jgi:hypothetical protein
MNEQTILLPAQVIADWEERLRQANCTEHQQAELRNLFQFTLPHPDALTPSSYYRHVIYLRDVMLFLMQSQVNGSLPADDPIAERCSQLNALFRTAAETGEAMPIPVSSVTNLDVKIEDICRLLSGQRIFGVPSILRDPQDATDSTESKTSGRKPTPLPKYLTLQSQDLKNPRPRPTVPKKHSLAYSLGEGAEHSERRPKSALGSSKTNPEAHADSEVMAQAWVNAPPEFTPAERRKRYVSLLNVQAAQNAVSRTDMQRFSKRQLSTWLESIAHEDPMMGIFVLLIWTLGMTPERLQTLCLSTQPPMGAQVLLNPHTHWLSYRVLNLGATSDADTLDDNGPVPANHLMQMDLPASLVERIVATGDERANRIQRECVECLPRPTECHPQCHICRTTDRAARVLEHRRPDDGPGGGAVQKPGHHRRVSRRPDRLTALRAARSFGAICPGASQRDQTTAPAAQRHD